MDTRVPLLISLALGLAALATVMALRPRDEAAPRHERAEATERVRRETAERELADERARREAAERELARLLDAEDDARVEAREAAAEDGEAEPPADEAAEAADDPGPPSDEELRRTLRGFGRSLDAVLRGGEAAMPVVTRLRAVLARCTAEQIDTMVARSADDTERIGARFVLSHALAQSGLPGTIEALRDRLRDPDGTMTERRVASHALAFADRDDVPPLLLEVARGTDDRGVRANAAFGAARAGLEEGLALYLAATDAAFEAGDPEAMQYLGGFGLLGEEVLPGLRNRMESYQSPQAVIVLIEIAKNRGDEGSLPQLRRLADDPQRPPAVRKAARGAIEVLHDAP